MHITYVEDLLRLPLVSGLAKHYWEKSYLLEFQQACKAGYMLGLAW